MPHIHSIQVTKELCWQPVGCPSLPPDPNLGGRGCVPVPSAGLEQGRGAECWRGAHAAEVAALQRMWGWMGSPAPTGFQQHRAALPRPALPISAAWQPTAAFGGAFQVLHIGH